MSASSVSASGAAPADKDTAGGGREPRTAARFYWSEHVNADGDWRTDPTTKAPKRPPGEDLAVLRSGLDHRAGNVLALFRYYATPTDGQVTTDLEAEHATLALYGLHQQSQDRPMHRPGVTLGAALLGLRRSGRFSEEAVDRRVETAANTTSVDAFRYRLRGLVTQLRTVGQPLDYTRLLRDIRDWHWPASRQHVRRRWGLDYYAWRTSPGQQNPPADPPATTS